MAEISDALYRDGSGEPLLLLHGFTGAWHHWRPVLAPLAKRYEVIAPTLAGHDGGPPLPPDIGISFHDSVDLLETHMDELGLGTVHAVGNSMGGALALELAKRGRARSVVAIAPAGGWSVGDGEARRLARFFARQLRLTRAAGPRMKTLVARRALRKLALRDVMCHGELASPAEALALAESSLRCSASALAIAALRADRDDLVLRDLERISCPVRLATPQFDRILPPAKHAPRYRREIPNVDSVTLLGCGHVPMWDSTLQVVRTISEFVDRDTGVEQPLVATS
ncbi:MAG TPA: alpha/beta hydrolase [Solirubrobacteraceae bacterium]|jgi:pimeloyl-ACP methyl ester carboxylesterase